MANPERGEVEIEVKGRLYTLKLSVNAAVTLERRLKKSVGALLREAGALHFESVRFITWLLLQKYHAKDYKTEDQAGDFIDDMGGVAAMFMKLAELAKLNEPPKDDPDVKEASAASESEDPSRALA